MTCGSVDDGKSTLVGRLIYESGGIYQDQFASVVRDSKKNVNGSAVIDYSLFMDGLSAERQQGITIDVAYTYFKTANRKFIVADTPGHLEYTCNMATAASKSEVAVILVSATDGLQLQTSRHVKISEIFGIKHICLVINKMDLVNYDQNIFLEQKNKFLNQIKNCKFDSVTVIPVSAINGDLLIHSSEHMKWYSGQSVLQYLETVSVKKDSEKSFVFPVQYVDINSKGVRNYLGTVVSGQLKIGDTVFNAQSMQKNIVNEIVVGDKSMERASQGQAISVNFKDQIDISRGDVLVADPSSILISQKFLAQIIWMSSNHAIVDKNYTIQFVNQKTTAQISKIKNKISFKNLNYIDADVVEMNDIASVEIELAQLLVIQKFEQLKPLGSFLLIDKISHQTLAAGIVCGVDSVILKNRSDKPKVIWFTGLSGAGKSTLAKVLEVSLRDRGFRTCILDGDKIRHGLSRDLGFSVSDRAENIRRIAEVTKLMLEAGITVIVAAISPYLKDRELAKQLIGADNFIEVYVSTSLKICEARDVKGLYSKARAGLVKNFTGIDSPYEEPAAPDIKIDTEVLSVDEAVLNIFNFIRPLFG